MCFSPRKWLRAFTLKETIYTIVEAILLLLLILFTVYLILHFSVCPPTQRSNKKQCGRNRVNDTELEAQEFGNGTQYITKHLRSTSRNTINLISKVTDETATRAGEVANDITSNRTTRAGLSVNDTLIVASEVTNGTVASINESNKSNTSELQSNRMNVVRTVKIEAAATTGKGIKSKESKRELKTDQSSEEEVPFYVEYEDEPGFNDTFMPKMKSCKKCEEAQREHESGNCDCGACVSNRTALLKMQAGAPPPAGTPLPAAASSPAGAHPTVGAPSTAGAPPTASAPSTAGAFPPADTLRRLTIVESKLTDDDAASELHKRLVLALVRAEPDDTFTYVCVVIIVAEFWSLGAASCIRDLRADTLGLYFLVERFGEAAMGESHGVVEAARGGGGAGAGGGGDALALRAGASLLGAGGRPARLADPLDHLLLVLGETFTALGYGKFRSIQAHHEDLRLRQTCINWVVGEACGAEGGGAEGGGAQGGGAGGGEFPLCAGVLYGAAAPCYYCGGTPLFRGDVLFALAAGGDERCGGDCPPRPYVTTPGLRGWLHDLLTADASPTDDYYNDDY